MNSLTWILLATLLLTVLAVMYWNWRSNAQLERLDERVRRQAEVLQTLDQALEAPPPLDDRELQARSEALLAQLESLRKS
ncbi:MAG TPA: hypothetical protein VJA19_15575 [Pseudomonas sp.]|nr:hypothetical protein [Pseudomonas sp.]